MRRLGRLGVGVHTNVTKITTEFGLHESPRMRIERFAARTQYVMHDGWYGYYSFTRRYGAIQAGRPFLAALAALTAKGALAAGALQSSSTVPGFEHGRSSRRVTNCRDLATQPRFPFCTASAICRPRLPGFASLPDFTLRP